MGLASTQVVVQNKMGLHARPAMQFVDEANKFAAEVTVKKGGDDPLEVNGKSIMEMLTLAALEGTPLTIEASGDDADTAVTTLAGLFAARFGEE